MRVRTLLIATAFLSAALGGVAAYLALTVPNDLRAGALLKTARQALAEGRNDEARKALGSVVQQYPRTDAAAAATVGLAKLADEERLKLRWEIDGLKRRHDQQARLLSDMQKNLTGVQKSVTGVQKSVTEVRNAPPQIVIQQAPPKKPPPTKPVRKAPAPRTRRP